MRETFDQNKDLLFRKHFHLYKPQEKGGLPPLYSLCKMNHCCGILRAAALEVWMEQGSV